MLQARGGGETRMNSSLFKKLRNSQQRRIINVCGMRRHS